MRRRYLTGLANLICRWPWLFVAAGIALAVAAGVYAARFLEFKTSRNDLIGRDSEYWRFYSEYASEFRAEEDYVIVTEGEHPRHNQEVVDALVAALLAPANNPHPQDHPRAQRFDADDVFYRVDFAKMEERFLFYLAVEELEQIRDSLKDFQQLVAILRSNPRLATFFDAMNQMLQQMETAPETERRRMESFLPTVGAIVEQMAEPRQVAGEQELLSPWASAFFSEQMLTEAEREFRWNGYHGFSDGRVFVVLVHPHVGVKDDAAALHSAAIAKLRRIIADVQKQYPEVKIGLTGEPVLDTDEMAQSQRDTIKATLLTLAVIFLLFFFSFHEILRPLLAAVCLVMVLAMSMGFATLSVGHLNIITVTFAVMILGLGIDLGIQFVARYEEELSKGGSRQQAVRTTIEHTGPSLITAGVTNAAAFFAMGLSGFRGVIELGVIAGGGMIIATATTIFVLPSLLLCIRRQTESRLIPAQATATRFENLLLRQPVAMLVLYGVLTVGALLYGWRVRFDYNVLNLQSRGLESVDTELQLLRTDAQSTIFAAVVCDTFEQTKDLHARLEKLPTVSSVASIAPFIPDHQEQKAAIIVQIQEGLGEVDFEVADFAEGDVPALTRSLSSLRLRTNQLQREAAKRGDAESERALRALSESLEKGIGGLRTKDESVLQPYLAEYQQRFFSDLARQFELMADQNVSVPITIEKDVPPEARRMLIGKTGKFLLRVFPRQNIWERDALVAFVRDVQTVAPKATGTPLGIYEFVDILQRGYRNAALWALLVIAIMIFIDFRGLYATALTILPLAVGMAWMFGVMGLAGIRFNPANIMVLPLLVGIGVAYGIYIVQRYREHGEATFYSKSTGRAVILSALTTMVAFASLILGAHRGISSLGLVMSIGVSACLVATMVLLPALLEIARRKGWKV